MNFYLDTPNFEIYHFDELNNVLYFLNVSIIPSPALLDLNNMN